MRVLILILFSLLPGSEGPFVQEIRLVKIPKVLAIEQDFNEPVITICRHEGTKIKFNVDFGGFTASDVRPQLISGQMDYELWNREEDIYLFNPKTETIIVQLWIKSELLKKVWLPCKEGKLASVADNGSFEIQGAEWKPATEILENKEGYTLFVPQWKLYSRVCE